MAGGASTTGKNSGSSKPITRGMADSKMAAENTTRHIWGPV